MKIYFTCSTAEFKKYRDTYFSIRKYLLQQGYVLSRDWLPHTEERLLKGDIEVRDIQDIYKACVTAIKDADAVIIDDTVSNFSTGHQITLALQYKKPTLVLWQGRKHREFKQMFIHGIESDLLQVSEYSNNYEEIIETFLKKYQDIHEKNRFHLVLSNPERLYLDWAQFTKNKSRTRVIRNALKQSIETDEEYLDFLKKRK